MPLTTQQREDAWAWLMKHRAPAGAEGAAKWTKADVRTALDAATTWIEANQASYVSGLAGTVFAGAASTADEKRRLFIAAFLAVYGIGVS